MSSDFSLNTNLLGRVRNTHLAKTSSFMAVYEAIVNSIHAVEELSEDYDKGCIVVEIIRSKQSEIELGDSKKPGPEAIPDIVSFKIRDSGVGFNEQNMKSFCTLDSDYKAHKGCKGVGRLLWLKVFDQVQIESNYYENGSFYLRQFDFNANYGIHNNRVTPSTKSSSSTTVILKNIKKSYRKYARKNISTIAKDILNHCLWYYIRPGSVPTIKVKDEDIEILLDDLYEELMVDQEQPIDVSIDNHKFTITHVHLPANAATDHKLVYCAGNRVVTEKKLRNLVPGLYGKLKDEFHEFFYYCYVSSSYLDENVRIERTGFNIEDKYPDIFKDESLSFEQIESKIISCVQFHLHDHIQQNKKAGETHLRRYVDHVAPKYKPLLRLIPPDELYVDPDASEKEIDLHLYGKTRKIELSNIEEGHELLKSPTIQNNNEFRERFNKYKEIIKELNQSKLADYVANRRAVIDFLEKALEWDDSNKYEREEVIHDLIMPMGKTSDTTNPDSCNLWLIDERLTFHSYLASDKPIQTIPNIESTSRKEPDIAVLKNFDTPILMSETTQPPLPSITIIEFKRPQRDDFKEGINKDPIEQVLNYVKLIRDGKAKTDVGRPIPLSTSVPGFCYIIADLTESLVGRCEMHSLQMTSDGLGYFGYHNTYNTYIEVYSYDRLIKESKERNRAFFDKLGLPCN